MNSKYLFLKEFSESIPNISIKILLSAIISWSILRFIIPYLSIWFIDKPNKRSSHKVPIPRAGGIVFVSIGIFG